MDRHESSSDNYYRGPVTGLAKDYLSVESSRDELSYLPDEVGKSARFLSHAYIRGRDRVRYRFRDELSDPPLDYLRARVTTPEGKPF
jgi:hypothetical protein